MITAESKIQYVPHQFRIPDPIPYPFQNRIDFELWLSKNITSEEIPGDWIFAPVLFTAFYKRNRFGEDKAAIKELQDYFDSLDASKKYFCVVQFDLGVMVDLSRLNIKAFAMAGGPCDYRLPLACSKNEIKSFAKKDIWCSFVGRRTHPIRDKVMSYAGIASYEDKLVYIQDWNHNPELYFSVLQRSIFSLCPRGFSASSFRIQESIESGAIPVYISNEFYDPHDYGFEKYGVLIKEDDIPFLFEILSSISEKEIKRKQEMLPTIYESLYSFPAIKNAILNQLKKWS